MKIHIPWLHSENFNKAMQTNDRSKDQMLIEAGKLIKDRREEFGLTRERVRQIKEKAIRRLRHRSRSRRLRSYLG